jgi:hypothetical protein
VSLRHRFFPLPQDGGQGEGRKGFSTPPGGRLILAALPLLGASWALLWTLTSYWNPLFFAGMWLGAALVMYAAGPDGHPGWRRHVGLALVSVPLWWWFELVNGRVDNWEYVTRYDYGAVQYALLASLTFSTVVPALDAASRLTSGWLRTVGRDAPASGQAGKYAVEAIGGLAAGVLVFAFPDLFFPLVWVGTFLVFDGLVALGGGQNLLHEIWRGRWRAPASIGLAGLMCGVLWEFWNFWATPNWIYHLPHFDYLDLFEMPALGYLGYIPFAWCVYQLVRLKPLRRHVGG